MGKKLSGGRPPLSENSKAVSLTLSMSKEEKETFMIYSRLNGMSRSAFFREVWLVYLRAKASKQFE